MSAGPGDRRGSGTPWRAPRSGRRWTALGMAICAIAGAGAAGAQTIWDDPAFALYRQAVEAINNKDYAGADRLAGEAIQQFPNHVLAHYLRGQAALAQSRWEPAAAAFARVIELYPGSFAGQRDLGIAQEELGRVDAAARAYEAALALRADDEDLRFRLGVMLLKARQQDRAVAVFQQLAERDTRRPEVWTALARVAFDAGDLAASEKAFARSVALRDEGRIWFNLGIVRARQNNFPGAIEAFERAARHPETKEQATRELDQLRAATRSPRPPGSDASRPAPAEPARKP